MFRRQQDIHSELDLNVEEEEGLPKTVSQLILDCYVDATEFK